MFDYFRDTVCQWNNHSIFTAIDIKVDVKEEN